MPFLTDTKDIALIITSATTVLATLYFSKKNYTYQQNVLKLQESNLLLPQSNLEIQKQNHHLQKSKENENELFKIKIEKYNIIFKLGFQIHQEIRDTLTATQKSLEKNELTEEEMYKLADEIDKKIDIYYDAVLLNLAFLPQKIYQLYDIYFDKTYKQLITDNENQEVLKQAFKVLDEMELDFFTIMEAMRVEIGYDSLNKKLRNRIRYNPQIQKDNNNNIRPNQGKSKP